MIKPNEIYMINKLNFASQANVMAKICTTLKYAEKEPIDPYVFLEYVSKGLAFGRCIILVTFNEKEDLSSCVVMFLNNNPIKGKILFLEWCWADSKSLKLSKKIFEKVEELAKGLKADRIAASMTRGFKAVYRRYGIKEVYTVVEKLVEKEVNKNVEKD